MKSDEALRVLADVTAYQWGMVTTAQASLHGVSRLDLSRLTEAGHFQRLAHGVYKDAGAPSDRFEDLKAAWLSTEPKTMGEARIKNLAGGIVVAGASAARLHGIGDVWAERHEFVSHTRRQSQRPEIRYRQRPLENDHVTLVHGLPVMTIERTLADLVEEVGDLSLVADALRDAALQEKLNFEQLREHLNPLAARKGFRNGDGDALLNQLLEIAGLDPETVARSVAEDAALGSLVSADFFDRLSKIEYQQLALSPEFERSLQAIQKSFENSIAQSLAPQLAAINAISERAAVNTINTDALERIANKVAIQVSTFDAIAKAAQEITKSLNKTAKIDTSTLKAIRATQNMATNDAS